MSISKEQLDTATEIVTNMIQRLGLSAEVKAGERKGDLLLTIDTPEPGRLIGRKGRSIDSLEYLLNRILGHSSEEFPRAILDVDGYQKKEQTGGGGEKKPAAKEYKQDRAREEKLEQLATDAAKEVKRWGEPKEIGPYSSHDRRLIHLALEDDAEIAVDTDPDADENAHVKKIIIRPTES